MKNKPHTLHWLRDLVNIGAAITGIVLTAIGSVMVLNATMKLYVFGFETNSYFNAEEQCTNDHMYRAKPEGEADKKEKMTDEELAKCVEKKTVAEKGRYQRQKKENIIDGLGFLIVGGALWFFHRRREDDPLMTMIKDMSEDKPKKKK